MKLLSFLKDLFVPFKSNTYDEDSTPVMISEHEACITSVKSALKSLSKIETYFVESFMLEADKDKYCKHIKIIDTVLHKVLSDETNKRLN